MTKKQKTSRRSERKRRIDSIRDGAGALDLRVDGDESAITAMIEICGNLLTVKGKGIYEIKMADQIDPGRTNPNVPNTVQRILPFGSNDPWIGQTLLTANGLFKSSYLPDSIDCDKSMAIALEITKIIGEMQDLARRFREEQDVALSGLDEMIRQDRSFVVPSVGDVAVKFTAFIQKSDHAVRELFRLIKIFYGDVGKGGWAAFADKIDNESGSPDNFADVLRNILPFLQLIRNTRNCVEHPRTEQKILTTDFSLSPQNKLVGPTIEIVHPKTPMDRSSAADFMRKTTDNIVEIVELMLAFLCGRHAQSFSGFQVHVLEIPPHRRTNQYVRFGYGVMDGESVIPMS